MARHNRGTEHDARHSKGDDGKRVERGERQGGYHGSRREEDRPQGHAIVRRIMNRQSGGGNSGVN